MRWGRAGIVVLLLAAALVGCGGGDKSGLTTGERQGLLAQLGAARASAAAGDAASAQAAIRKFRVSVARLQRSGALTAEEARTLRLGAAHVLAQVQSAAAPPAQPTQTTPAPTPTPQPAEPPGQAKKKHEEKKKEKKKHGKGKGEGD